MRRPAFSKMEQKYSASNLHADTMASAERWMMYSVWILSSALSYQLLQYILAPSFYSCISATYRKFTDAQKLKWNIRFSSITNSVVVGSLAVRCLLQPEVWKVPMRINYLPIELCVCICWGYFITDMMWMIRYPVESEAGLTYKFHHMLSMVGFFVVLHYKTLGLFISIRFLSEWSQPFAHLRSTYKDCECKNRALYFLIAICFTTVFTVVRVAVQPFFYLMVYGVINSRDWMRLNMLSHFVWLGVGGFLDVLNIYWFVLIVRGIWRILKKSTSPTSNC